MKQRIAARLIVLFLTPVWLGCAHETTTVTTTETSECADVLHVEGEVDPESCETRVEETVITTEIDRCHGIVSCTFVVVGEVIALPFRILGEALGAIL